MSKMPSFIEQNGVFITKPNEMANYFNNYYKEKVEIIRNEMHQVSGVSGKRSETIIKQQIMCQKNSSFDFKSVKNDDIIKVLTEINSAKPCGIDNMDGRLLKFAAKSVAQPLCHIFNLCLQEGIYPNLWKKAKNIPIMKNSKVPLTGQNSRPISILPVLSKLMEKVMFQQIQDYFNENHLYSNVQHVYKEGYSTSTARTALTDDWLRQIDRRQLVGAVFLDFSAAFDQVDHKLLLKKLWAYGFRGSAVKYLRSYLANRTQHVFFNGSLSDPVFQICGVPQGSCLGPLLYSIFVNDLPDVLSKASMTVYADDSTGHVSASSLNQVNSKLQKELNSIQEWVVENRLIFFHNFLLFLPHSLNFLC